ncbi:MAG: hypothetical protein A3F67_04355 [Verrucomicrobia bacterium RIFCSPHIGHO2_12_FULL_41_10]|nr:MAG: hypothetical protein A3F67_04355 [Verrucomicrobia bacterium RIFCSPHIGHO2_12_FULL_41_10]HLB33597.1 hypothetical protein [Chthoniobacterales bacterium]
MKKIITLFLLTISTSSNLLLAQVNSKMAENQATGYRLQATGSKTAELLTTDFSFQIGQRVESTTNSELPTTNCDNSAGNSNYHLMMNPSIEEGVETLREALGMLGKEAVITDTTKAIEATQHILAQPDTSRLFVPPVKPRGWGEYFMQSSLQARTHENVIAIIQGVDQEMNQSIEKAGHKARAALQAAITAQKELQDLPKTSETAEALLSQATEKAKNTAFLAAAAANKLSAAKEPSAYALCLAKASSTIFDRAFNIIEERERNQSQRTFDSAIAYELELSTATAATMYKMVVEAAEQALVAAFADVVTNPAITVEQLLSNERIKTAAHLVAISRITATKVEGNDFSLAKNYGPRITAEADTLKWDRDIPKSFICFAQNTIRSAQSAHNAIINGAQYPQPSLPLNQSVLIMKAIDAAMAYRTETQDSHHGHLTKHRSEGDLYNGLFTENLPTTPKKSSLQFHDIAIDAQIATRLAGCTLCPNLNNEIAEKSQLAKTQLKEAENIFFKVGNNSKRYYKQKEVFEKFVNFAYMHKNNMGVGPDYVYFQGVQNALKEIDGAASARNESDSASIVRELMEISVANAMIDLSNEAGIEPMLKNCERNVRFESFQFSELYRSIRTYCKENLRETASDIASLDPAVTAITSNPFDSNSYSTMGETATERMSDCAKSLLMDELRDQMSIISSIDVLLAVRQAINPSGVLNISRAVNNALPAIMSIHQHIARAWLDTATAFPDNASEREARYLIVRDTNTFVNDLLTAAAMDEMSIEKESAFYDVREAYDNAADALDCVDRACQVATNPTEHPNIQEAKRTALEACAAAQHAMQDYINFQ